jgi:hypothetical protein
MVLFNRNEVPDEPSRKRGPHEIIAGFMAYLNSNLAREVGRLNHWKEKIWGRRYQSIPVSSEQAASHRPCPSSADRPKKALGHRRTTA